MNEKTPRFTSKPFPDGFGNGVIFLPSATAPANPTPTPILSRIKPEKKITGQPLSP